MENNKWFRHVMRISDAENLKAAVEWKLSGKRSRCHPKNRWMYGIVQDLDKLKVVNWEDRLNNWKEWKEMVVVAKILEELWCQ